MVALIQNECIIIQKDRLLYQSKNWKATDQIVNIY